MANVAGAFFTPRAVSRTGELMMRYARNAVCDDWDSIARQNTVNGLLSVTRTHPYASQRMVPSPSLTME